MLQISAGLKILREGSAGKVPAVINLTGRVWACPGNVIAQRAIDGFRVGKDLVQVRIDPDDVCPLPILLGILAPDAGLDQVRRVDGYPEKWAYSASSAQDAR